MIRMITNNKLLCVLILSVFASGSALLMVSQHVYNTERSVQSMTRDVVETQWNIRALKAELAYLSRPDRLDEIASAAHTQQSPISTANHQFTTSIIAPVSLSFERDESDNGNLENDSYILSSITPHKKPSYIYAAQDNIIAASASISRDNAQGSDFSSMLNLIGGVE